MLRLLYPLTLDPESPLASGSSTRALVPVAGVSTGAAMGALALPLSGLWRAASPVRPAVALRSLSCSRPEPELLPCSPRRPAFLRAPARTGSRLAAGDTECLALTPARASGATLLPLERGREPQQQDGRRFPAGKRPHHPDRCHRARSPSTPASCGRPGSGHRTHPSVQSRSEQCDVATRLRRAPHRSSLLREASFAALAGAQESLPA